MYKISRSQQWRRNRAKISVSTNSFTITQFANWFATPNAVVIYPTIGSRALNYTIFASFLKTIFVSLSYNSEFEYYSWEKK